MATEEVKKVVVKKAEDSLPNRRNWRLMLQASR